MMKLSLSEEQQYEMRHAYFDGAPGILVSGFVWISSSLVCYLLGLNNAVWTLLIGGAFIYPMSVIVTKMLGRSAKTNKTNALNQLVMASTIWLILGCAMAYGLFLLMPKLFFPAMMATIGCRYLVFASVFGRLVFWIMGASLIATGYLMLILSVEPFISAGFGGLIEVLFSFFVFSNADKKPDQTLT